MDYEPFHRKKRRMVKDCLAVGWSFEDTLSRLRLTYTDFIFLFPDGLEWLTTLKVIPVPDFCSFTDHTYTIHNYQAVDRALENGVYLIFDYRWKEKSYMVNDCGHYYFISPERYYKECLTLDREIMARSRDKKIVSIIGNEKGL